MKEEDLLKFIKIIPPDVLLDVIKILENRITELEEIEKEHQKTNGELQEKIKELRKPKYIIDMKTNEITELKNDFISKDKIETKIDELKKNMLDTENIEVFYQRRFCYDILLELLEEKDD